MKFTVIFTLIVFGAVSFAGHALANTCEQKAAALAAEQNARVLSVEAKGKSCKIKLLVESAQGAPKRKTVIVNK